MPAIRGTRGIGSYAALSIALSSRCVDSHAHVVCRHSENLSRASVRFVAHGNVQMSYSVHGRMAILRSAMRSNRDKRIRSHWAPHVPKAHDVCTCRILKIRVAGDQRVCCDVCGHVWRIVRNINVRMLVDSASIDIIAQTLIRGHVGTRRMNVMLSAECR